MFRKKRKRKKREKELVDLFEAGKVLQVDNDIDNKEHFKPTEENDG